jgi:hypothetical protein
MGRSDQDDFKRLIERWCFGLGTAMASLNAIRTTFEAGMLELSHSRIAISPLFETRRWR